MKTSYQRKSQRGFFDLGRSLLVLAVAGGSVLLIEQQQVEKPDAQPAATTVVDLAKGKVN